MRAALRARVAEAAEQVAALAAERPGKTIYVKGAMGSGRSSVLAKSEEVLLGRGYNVVTVAPPARHYDTAAVALLDAAVGLQRSGYADDFQHRWRGSCPWDVRVADVRSSLLKAAADSKFVLVLDDPSRWAIPEAVELRARFEAVIDVLMGDLRCTRVIATASDIDDPDAVSLGRLSASDVFRNADDWGDLAGDAVALGDALPELASRTPAEIGFAVALTALTSVEEVLKWWNPRLTVEFLADKLVELVKTEPTLRPLWVSWLSFSVPRRTLSGAFGLPVKLLRRPEVAAIFERCLLTVNGDRLAREARAAAWRTSADVLSDRIRASATDHLLNGLSADYEEAVRSNDVGQLLVAAELIHHAGRAGDRLRVQAVPAALSDQLDAVGLTALERLDQSMAVLAFELALDIDDRDAIARHYLGFTLDAEAREPLRAEKSYEMALELDGSHATWHSRLICFLVVQARMADAKHRWSWSRAQLTKDDGGGPLDLFSHLHLPVSAQLLRRAELHMARTVLGDVPQWAHKQLPSYSGQLRRLQLLELAEESGVFVPADRVGPSWWMQPPELLSDRHPDGRPLQQWMTGTVEAVSDDAWTLYVAIVRGRSRPSVGTATLTWEQVDEMCSDRSRLPFVTVGDFVELGFYGHGSELGGDAILRILPNRTWGEGIETELESDRYIKRAFA